MATGVTTVNEYPIRLQVGTSFYPTGILEEVSWTSEDSSKMFVDAENICNGNNSGENITITCTSDSDPTKSASLTIPNDEVEAIKLGANITVSRIDIYDNGQVVNDLEIVVNNHKHLIVKIYSNNVNNPRIIFSTSGSEILITTQPTSYEEYEIVDDHYECEVVLFGNAVSDAFFLALAEDTGGASTTVSCRVLAP